MEQPAAGRLDEAGGQRVLAGGRTPGRSVAFSCTGEHVAGTSLQDATVRLWSVASGAVTDLAGHTLDSCVDFDSKRPELLASASRDRTLRLWDTRMAGSHTSLATAGENVHVRWAPDGLSILTLSSDDVLSIFDARKHKVVASKQFDEPVYRASWEPSSTLLLVACGSGAIDIIDPLGFDSRLLLQGHTDKCTSLHIPPAGPWFASGAHDAVVALWSRADLVCVRTFADITGAVRDVALSSDGAFLAVAADDQAPVYETASGAQVAVLARAGAVNALAWHPSRPLLAFAGEDANRKDAPIVLLGLGDSASAAAD